MEVYHLEKCWEAALGKLEIAEESDLRVVLKAVHPISNLSTLEQKIIISANSRKIEFDNNIDWHENRKIFKVHFPVQISNDTATFETQFGVLQRPTHYNNSWFVLFNLGIWPNLKSVLTNLLIFQSSDMASRF